MADVVFSTDLRPKGAALSTVPPWLKQMQQLEGVHFSPENVTEAQTLHNWLDFIGDKYEEMRRYCQTEKSLNYFPWCGLALAYCMAKTGHRPVFGAGDEHRFLRATAWLDWGAEVPRSHHGGWTPEPGDVVVFDFGTTGHHVTLFNRDLGDGRWECWGGNQSHALHATSFPSSQARAVRRPDVRTETKPDDRAQHFQGLGSDDYPWSLDLNPDFQSAGGYPMAALAPEVIAAAQRSQAKWGVPASITLAQFILESAAGEKMPPGSNNPFGIKAAGNQPFVMALTTEEHNGQRFQIRAPFRKFSSFDEAFDAHGQLLARHYQDAMAHADDPDAFADKLTGHYATASNYGKALKDTMSRYNLRRYDTASPSDAGPRSNWSVWPESASSDPSSLLKSGSTGAQVKALQESLTNLGYPLGEVDGVFGPLTQQALLAFQADNDLLTDGEAGPEAWNALTRARPRSLPKKRADATIDDLLPLSRILQGANRTKQAGLFAMILAGLGFGNSIATNAGTGLSINTANVSPEMAQTLTKVLEALNKTAATGKTPIGVEPALDIGGPLQVLLNQISANGAHAPPQFNTVVDFVANNPQITGVLHTALQFLASIAGSIVPGFGGSLLALGLGIAARYFGSKIMDARVEDHNTGKNISPLRS